MTSKVITAVYPVAGGAVAALTTKELLQLGRRFVVGNSTTPSGRRGGGTAWVWTALSWAVSAGVGLYAGKKLVRKSVAVQPAQS